MSNENELFKDGAEPIQTVEDVPTDPQPNALMQVIQAEHVEPETGVAIQSAFAPFFADADEWRLKAAAIKVTDVSQKADMAMARVIRLKLKDIRVQADKKRKDLKEDFLRYGRAVQGAYNILEYLIVPLEKSLEEAEKFAEIQEAKRQEELRTSREIQLTPWKEFVPFGLNLGTMTEDDFAKVLAGAKLQQQAKIDAEARAEQERLERLRAEEAERQRIAEENRKLREENEAKEKALAAERAKAEADRLAAEKVAAKAKAEADAKLAAERAEREKLENEIRAKAQAEADEKERQRVAAEKALSASDDVKLETFAVSLEAVQYPVVASKNAQEAVNLAKSAIANIVASVRGRIGK
jgi:hypothetical protein